MKNLNIIFAVVGGALAGAALGLLFAPEKGDDTRRKIVDFVKSKCPCDKKADMDKLVDEIAGELRKSK